MSIILSNINKLIKISLVIVTICSIFLVDVQQSIAQTLSKPKVDIQTAISKTGALMYKNTPNPNVGTLSGEWTILSLARSGYKVPQSYYDKYYDNVVKTLKECDGNLHNVKYTEYSRVILALTSIGKDVRDVGGYNLLEKLADFNKVIKQGINGPIFALIALDTNNYEIPIVENIKVQTTREMLIDYILNKEIKKGSNKAGGWALSGDIPDPDITAMALQSLANYKDDEKVKPYIDRALGVLSDLQLETGGYSSWGTSNSESIAQVIVALTALEIDPSKDSRFIKSGDKWTISEIMEFYVDDGGFKHVKDKDIDAMATDQGMYSIAAYDRFIKGKNKLYDMTDAKETLNIGEVEENEDKKEDKNDLETNKEPIKQNNKPLLTQKPAQGLTNKEIINKVNTKYQSSSNNTNKDKNKSKIITQILCKGDEYSTTLENKQIIAVQFPDEKAIPQIRFNSNNLLYYSNELSNKSQTPTYVGVFNKEITLDKLNDINTYKFDRNITSKTITFGDVNSDNRVNAQDVLNTISVVLGKKQIVDDSEIISMDTNGDSKIDNLDIINIKEKYISKKECSIVSKLQ